MNWKPPEFTEAEVRELLSRKPGQPKIVKYPENSAWDEIEVIRILCNERFNKLTKSQCVAPHLKHDSSTLYREALMEYGNFIKKYTDELKQLRAKD